MTDSEDLSNRTRSGLMWVGGEAFTRVGLQLVVLLFLARLLTPVDFGVVGVAQVIIGIASTFGLLGVGPALVQRTDLEADHIRAAWAFSMLFGIAAAGIVFFCAPAFAAFFAMPGLTAVLQWLALVFPIAGMSVVPESLLQRELQFRTLARIEVSSTFVGFGCVAIILALLHFGLWALVLGQLVQMTARSAQMMVAASNWPSFSLRWKAFRDLFQYSAGQTAANLANYIATNGDNLIVGKFLGAEPMGIYSRAYQLMLGPALLVGSVLEKVLFPVLSRIQKERDLLKRSYRQSNHLLGVIILPFAAVIWLLAPDAIPFALGEKWNGVVLPLQLFSIGLLWRTGMKVSNSIIRACGAVRIFAICQFTYAVSVVLFAWIGSHWGIPGVCLGVLASILGCYSFCAAICFRLTNLRLSEFLLDHLPGSSLCAMVAAVGWITLYAVHFLKAPALVSLIVTTLAVGFIVVVAVAAFPSFFLGVYGAPLKAKLAKWRKPAKTAAPTVIPPSNPSVDNKNPRHRMETLDVFRGLAAVGVLLYHYNLRYRDVIDSSGGQQAEGYGMFLQAVFPWFFFVISGFVIFMTLSRTKNSLDFIVSRFSRLYPAYWAAVLVTFTVMTIFPIPGRTYPWYVVAVNMTMLQTWFHQPHVDGVYWTLMIELSFYGLMFVIFKFKQLARIQWIGLAWLIIQCLIAIGERAIHREIPSVIANTFLLGYFQLFFAGILFYKIRIEGWHWFQCILLGFCVITHGIVHNSLVAAAEALLFAVIFALFVSNRLHFLCNRPLLFLGSISYTLYLIHQNIGYTVIYHLSLVHVPHWACVLLAAGISLVLASLLTHFVEKPALKAIRDKYKQHRIQKEILITRRPATTSSVQ